MDEMELTALIDSELSVGLGRESDTLSNQRAKAVEYYLGEPFGDEQEDRSDYVSSDVRDTIEWIKPELLKLFASGNETVRCEPERPNDIEAAQQATDYLNYLLHRKNDGFKILHDWITDGLLSKTGVVKVWYDDEATKTREDYVGLSPLEAAALVADDSIEMVDQDTDGETVSLTVIRSGAKSGLKIEVIPNEEFIISRKATDGVQNSPFCAHQTRMTLSDLKAMGHELDEIPSGAAAVYEAEEYARHKKDQTQREELDATTDKAMTEVWVTEAYVRCDWDDDGIAELRKVLKVGDQILENEEVDCMPFAAWSPVIIPHKFHGLSVADLVMDIQRLQSQLFRNVLDNQYLTNNGRYEALEHAVDLDDLLDNRPGGVVRTKVPGAVKRLDTPQLGPSAYTALEYVDRLREKRTGVSERTQGLDPNQLSANTAASAVNQVMTAAQQRVELIARVFGETGLKDLFKLMYKLVIQNPTSKEIFRLRDKYVEVNPSDWLERSDFSVVVGLGNGSREQEMMQLNMIFQNQMQLMSNPQTAGIVTPANIYHTLEDQVKVFDKTASGRHFTDPDSPEAKQKAAQMAQQQAQMAQMQQQMAQMQIQLQQAAQQLDQVKEQNRHGEKVAEIDIKQQAQNLDELEHKDRLELDTAELHAEVALEAEQNRGVNIG